MNISLYFFFLLMLLDILKNFVLQNYTITIIMILWVLFMLKCGTLQARNATKTVLTTTHDQALKMEEIKKKTLRNLTFKKQRNKWPVFRTERVPDVCLIMYIISLFLYYRRTHPNVPFNLYCLGIKIEN